MIYELKLINGSKESVVALDERAQKLSDEITGYRGFNSDPTKRSNLDWLAHDIRYLRFWNILGWIGGYSSQKDEDEKRHARLEAELDFSYDKLERMFNIIVNSALFAEKQGAPGYDRGHTILHDAIASNRHSMFYESFPEQLHKRLINGMFWEIVGERNYAGHRHLEDVLMNHFNDLKTSFATRGLKLFSRNSVCRKAVTLYFSEENGLSRKAIRKYGEFVKKLDKRMFALNLSPHDIKPLAEAYIDAVNGKDEWDCPILDDYKQLRKDLFVLKYSRN